MEINIEKLLKQFGEQTAVDIPTLHIPAGSMLGIVGNNGAGKTTLLRLMLDLLKADKGRILLDGTEVSHSEQWKRETGAFIDSSFLIDYLSPEEYFQFLARTYRIPLAEMELRLHEFDAFMNHEICGQNKLIRDFSMGNQQKTGIIAALLHRPSLVILDEPFNYLDPTSQIILKDMLMQYHKHTQATIVLSSHNLQHTTDICSRIVLMEQGSIIKDIDNLHGEAEKELNHYFSAKHIASQVNES